jgi:hypothetical protein
MRRFWLLDDSPHRTQEVAGSSPASSINSCLPGSYSPSASRASSPDAALSGGRLLGILNPADELVAGQRRDVLPGIECRGVDDQRLTQVRGQLMHPPHRALSCERTTFPPRKVTSCPSSSVSTTTAPQTDQPAYSISICSSIACPRNLDERDFEPPAETTGRATTRMELGW